jgi:hypothetical protein
MTRSALLLLSLTLVACDTVPPPLLLSQASRACAPVADSRGDLGISPDSARLEPFVYPFIEKVNREPGFSDLWIQHQPRYHVVVAFTRRPPLSEVQRLAPPDLRDRIEVRTAKRSRDEIAILRDAIASRLQTGGLAGWSSGYNPKTQCFEITVASNAAIARVRSLLTPEQLLDADLRIGPIPHQL